MLGLVLVVFGFDIIAKLSFGLNYNLPGVPQKSLPTFRIFQYFCLKIYIKIFKDQDVQGIDYQILV